MPTVKLIDGHLPDRVDDLRTLFREYADWLNVDLCFQDFEAELAGLPGEYAPPRGRALLADVDGQLAGCVGLRPLADGWCEMKRMYVRPAARGLGLGRRLAERIVTEGRALGYAGMRLDTLDRLVAAKAIYGTLGFRETASYYDNPLEGVQYFALPFSAATDQTQPG